MTDCMMFPNDWAKFLEDYSFRDSDEVYTNGARLIPTFRVEQMMEHYLRKAVAENWIPVTERLPVDWCPVLVMVRDVGKPLLGSYRENVWFHENWNTTFINGAVTHWMPLPKPPKEE